MDCIIYSVLTCNDQQEIKNLLSGMKGLANMDLHAVHHQEISAVYGEINHNDLKSDPANAIVYASVVEILSQHFPLLPMRYGSMMESPEAIVKMLERNYPEFQHNLKKVENQFEYGLKVFGDQIKILETFTAGNGKTNHDEVSSAEIKGSVFRDYVNKKLQEHRKEELLVSYVDGMINEIKENLIRMHATGKFKKMVTGGTFIDAVFLLEKGKKSQLIEIVKDLQKRYGELNFVVTGPWPPYSFVEITLK